MSEPLVSVVIASYNRFDSLQNSLNSVLEQDYENFEIIVVNDASDDKRYYEKNLNEQIKFIHINRSETPDWGGARKPIINTGVDQSKGKYIAFLDDDDIWMPNKLTKQIKQLEEKRYKFSSTEGFYGKGFYNKEKNYPLYNKQRWRKFIKRKYLFSKYFKLSSFPEIWKYDFIKIHNCIVTSSVIIEKNFFQKLGGFRGIPRNSDYDLWLSALKETDLIYIDDPLFYYDDDHAGGRKYSK